MQIPSAVLNRLRRDPFSVFSAILGLVLFFTEGIKKIRYAEDLLREITNKGVIKPHGTGELQLRLWYANTLFFAIVLLIFVTALYIRSLFNRELPQGQQPQFAELAEVREKLRRVHEAFERTMTASLRMRHQVTPSHHKPALEMSFVEITYVIRSTCDAHITRRHDVKALTSAVHFWDVFISVDDDADEVDFLDFLDFKVEDISQKGVVYLPVKNESRSKGVALIFLPSIEVNEPTPRQIKIEYKWPGFANRLKNKKYDRLTWDLKGPPFQRLKLKFSGRILGENSK